MGSRRDKRRSKKRALALRDQAWEAACAGNLPLAGRLIHRSLDEGPGNSRSWLVLGRIQALGGAHGEAEASLRHALELSPDYPDALAELAGVLARQAEPARSGDAERLVEAVALQERVVALEPGRTEARQRLRAWRERLPRPAPQPELLAARDPEPPDGARTDGYDWSAIEEQLLARGCAPLPALLTEGERRAIAERALGVAASDLVDELRRELYWRLAPLAARRAEHLGAGPEPDAPPAFPALYEELLAARARAGRRTPATSLRAPVRGAPLEPRAAEPEPGAFPFRLDVALGPPEGGPTFRLVDARHGKKERGTELVLAAGDGVVSCARDRLVLVGGVYGLQPVLHGLVVPAQGRWRALRVPF